MCRVMAGQVVCVLLSFSWLMLTTQAQEDTAPPAGLQEIHKQLQQLRNITQEQATELSTLKVRLENAEQQLKAQTAPKVAFAVSLGSTGLISTKNENKKLIYKDILTNTGNAYNPETGVFKAPVRGVYYIRFTVTAPTDGLMSVGLYKNDTILLIVQEPPIGPGSDTASNGAALLLESGEELYLQLSARSQIWDNHHRHSTFSGFLLYTL